MKRFVIIITALLSLVVQGISAADGVILRGCRVGTPNPQFVPRRAPFFDDRNGSTDSIHFTQNPYIGNRRQLVVMASFQDQDFAADHAATLTHWDNIFNAEGYSEGGYYGSVRDYFLAQSYGLFPSSMLAKVRMLIIIRKPSGLTSGG